MSAESDAGAICKSCGACCDGSLHPRVGITLKEREGARKSGLRVVQGEPFFELPCSKLVDKACSIYDDRPGRCRLFVCNLIATHEREGLPLEESLEKVRRFRELGAQLRARGVDPRSTEPLKFEGMEGFEVISLLHEYTERLERDFERASPLFTDEEPKEAYTVPEGELPAA